MRVELHIEEMVLDGLGDVDRDEVGAAVERELARLLAEQGVPPALRQGGEAATLPGGRFDVTSGAGASEVGAQVARAVYGSFGR